MDILVADDDRIGRFFAEFRPARGWDTASPKPRMGVMPGMNHILGFAQLLASRKGLTEKQEASVRQILESGRPLLMLIDHILRFSKSDPSELSFEAVVAPRAEETKSLRSLSLS